MHIPKNFPPLKPGGWESFKTRLLGLLRAEDIEHLLLENDKVPTARENAYGIHLLNCVVADQYLPFIERCTTGREAYKALERLHKGDTITKYSTLMERLLSLEKKDLTIDQYVNEALDLQRDLKGAGETLTEQAFCVALLKGLPTDYDTIKQMMREKKPEDLTLEELRFTLKRREFDLSVQSGGGSQVPGMLSIDAKALAALAGGKGFPGKSQDARRGKGRGMKGKGAKGDGSSGGNQKGKGKGTNNGKKFGKGKGSGKGRKEATCWTCGKEGHYSWECRNGQKAKGQANQASEADTLLPPHLMNQLKGKALNTHTYIAGKCNPTKWILDSGADYHMTPCLEMIQDYQEELHDVEVANGIVVKAHGTGTVLGQSTINGKLVKLALHKVWYVPDLVHSLMSLKQLHRCGCNHIGGGGKIIIFDKAMEPVLVCEEDDHSFVPVWHVYFKPGHANSALTQTQSASLWHQRFGHTSYNVLADMVEGGMVNGIDVSETDFRKANKHTCEVCVMAKFATKPYKSRDKIATVPMECLHMDICGPYEVPTFSGGKFAVALLDEASGYADAMVLKTKAEAKFWLMKTINEWETRSGHKCKRIKADRGGEFLNKLLAEFFALKGIIPDFTPGYCHESNGRAERLMRSMNDKVRSMLYHYLYNHLYPNRDSFWGEALRYAMYIRNCTLVRDRPSTPMYLFEGQVPDVSKLRTFGCKVFAKVPLELRHKLDPRCHIGLYLGNERDTNGHRVLVVKPNGKPTVKVVRDIVTMEPLTLPSDVQTCEPQVCPVCHGQNQYKDSLPTLPQGRASFASTQPCTFSSWWWVQRPH